MKTRVKKKQRNKKRNNGKRKKKEQKGWKNQITYFIEKQGKGLYLIYLIKNIFSTKTIKLKQKTSNEIIFT